MMQLLMRKFYKNIFYQRGKTMKKIITACMTSALIFGSSIASAEDDFEISANVALASNYLFYGASQTAGNGTNDGGPAISGGFDAALPFEIFGGQMYVGTWASNVEWGAGTNSASIELDYYGGFAGDSIGSSGISWDVGAWSYSYPGQNDAADATEDFDYIEIYGNFGYTFESMALAPSLSVGIYYSPDYFGSTNESYHIPVGIDIALPADFGLSLGYGYFNVDNNTNQDDYSYYSVGIGKSIVGVDLSASWTGATDDCGAVQATNCGGFVFGVSKAF